MSPRPHTPPGTYGKIVTRPMPPTKEGKPRYRARTRYRERSGDLVQVTKFGQTITEAERELKKAIAERQETPGGTLTGRAKVAKLAEMWLEDDPSAWSVNTRQEYAGNVARYVVPRMGALRLSEVDTGMVASVLRDITREHGPSAAKSAKSCLNGMFGLAVRYGALTVNPVREAGKVSTPRKRARALTPDDLPELTDRLRSHERAVAVDLPDLVDWMLATGCRIGEAMAMRDGLTQDRELRLDLEAGIWEVDATAIRVKGQGVVIQERPKSEAGWRRITVPMFAMEMLRRRQDELRLSPKSVRLMTGDGKIREETGLWVPFPSPGSKSLRDGANTQADLREVLDGLDCQYCDGTGYLLNEDGTFQLKKTKTATARIRCRQGPWSWVTSHTFRKTVVTQLLNAGIPPQEVSDHVGHGDPSMTLNRYAGRNVVSAAAAKVLER